MKFKFFDIETYLEHFCCVIHSAHIALDGTETTENVSVYESDNTGHLDKDTIQKIYLELSDPEYYIISYNGKKFDLPVLAKIYRDQNRYGSYPVKYIFTDAQNLISYDKNNNPMTRHNHNVIEWNNHHFDMLNCCLIDKSLKQWEMYCGLDIREMPFQPGTTGLTREQKDKINEYCKYDCWALMQIFIKWGYTKTLPSKACFTTYLALFNRLEPRFKNRFDRTPASLAATHIYGTDNVAPKTMDPLQLFDLTKFDLPIDIKIIIAKLAKTTNKKLIDTEYNKINYGKGGAHFAVKGFVRDIYEFDVAGQYPSIIILWKLLKTIEALQKFTDTRDERLRIKKDPALKALCEALKLILNSLSGAFRIKSAYSLAYDPAAGEAMCYIAQCIISELALSVPPEALAEVNTDSVFVIGPEAAELARKKIAQLTEKYKMVFEEEHADAIYFSDVNNYIVYKLENNIYKYIRGKGEAFSDMNKKGSITAVYKILFNLLPNKELPEIPWKDYAWTEYIYKYHKSAASKYATIGEEPMKFKNYYFLWTTKDCPNAKTISFSRDRINMQNGSLKARYGVWSQSIKELEQYKDYLDYEQYHRDLDDELELWNREDLCTTRIPKAERKTMRDILMLGVK